MRRTMIPMLMVAAACGLGISGPAALARSDHGASRHEASQQASPQITTQQVIDGGGQTNGCTARKIDRLTGKAIPPVVARDCGMTPGGGDLPIG